MKRILRIMALSLALQSLALELHAVLPMDILHTFQAASLEDFNKCVNNLNETAPSSWGEYCPSFGQLFSSDFWSGIGSKLWSGKTTPMDTFANMSPEEKSVTGGLALLALSGLLYGGYKMLPSEKPNTSLILYKENNYTMVTKNTRNALINGLTDFIFNALRNFDNDNPKQTIITWDGNQVGATIEKRNNLINPYKLTLNGFAQTKSTGWFSEQQADSVTTVTYDLKGNESKEDIKNNVEMFISDIAPL